jgi:hypothetical protein
MQFSTRLELTHLSHITISMNALIHATTIYDYNTLSLYACALYTDHSCSRSRVAQFPTLHQPHRLIIVASYLHPPITSSCHRHRRLVIHTSAARSPLLAASRVLTPHRRHSSQVNDAESRGSTDTGGIVRGIARASRGGIDIIVGAVVRVARRRRLAAIPVDRAARGDDDTDTTTTFGPDDAAPRSRSAATRNTLCARSSSFEQAARRRAR